MAPHEWERIEPLLARVERPARYIDSEWGVCEPVQDDYRAVLVYPDTYEVGMANQAIQILYDLLNSIDGVSAERAFVPWVDMSDELRRERVLLSSLESGRLVREARMVGITLPYELTTTNILEFLDLSGIPLRSSDRAESDPLVVGGGPCAFNPAPLAPFFDLILIGDGEEAAPEIVSAHQEALTQGLDRASTLEALSAIPGVYVPGLCAEGAEGARGDRVDKRVLADLGSHPAPTCPIVPYMDVVHDRAMIEVQRGCTRGCRFCQAGMVYRPVRERSADDVVRDAMQSLTCTGHDEVSLTSLSTTDHSQLEEIMRRLSKRLQGTATTISLPSLRADAFSVQMARLASSGKKSGLTFAPEAGTQRLRDVINKNVTEDELMRTIEQAFSAGWRRVKLYFMIGLPTETDEDVRAIGELVGRVLRQARETTPKEQRGSLRIAVSVSTFVPKSHTPFQWDGQLPSEEIVRRQELIRDAAPRKGVELSWHDRDVSLLEAVIARGGQEIADVIETAWRNGARYDAWTERFNLAIWRDAAEAHDVDLDALARRDFGLHEPLPWDVVSSGVSREYLMDERNRALEGLTTEDCSISGCTGCDVCQDLGVDVLTAGERRE